MLKFNFCSGNIAEITLLFFYALSSILFAQQVEADERSYQSANALIDDFKQSKGRAPSVDDYFNIILDQQYFFSLKESFDLWKLVSQIQNPPIKTSELISLSESKKKSINDFTSKFRIKYNDVLKNKTEETSYDYVIKDNRYIVDAFYPEDPKSRTIKASNGENSIFISGFHEEVVPTATISEGTDASIFLPSNPLCQAMLFDTVAVNMPNIVFDFSLCKDMTVFENIEKLENEDCIVLASQNRIFYLDPQKDYAVVKKERYRNTTQEYGESYRITGRYLSDLTVLHDHKNMGNGVWLPMKVEYTKFNHEGEVLLTENIIVENMAMNTDISNDLFTDVIPYNAMVNDRVQGLLYRNSDSATIGSLLKDTVKNKRVMTYRYISVSIGLALIFIALVMKFRNSRKSKKEI